MPRFAALPAATTKPEMDGRMGDAARLPERDQPASNSPATITAGGFKFQAQQG
jgi:hypothetical protein